MEQITFGKHSVVDVDKLQRQRKVKRLVKNIHKAQQY